MNTNTNTIRLPARSIATPSPMLVAPIAVRVANDDQYIDAPATLSSQKPQKRHGTNHQGAVTQAPEGKKKAKSETEQKKKPPRPGELYPQIPTRTVPTMGVFQRLSPTALYAYRNERNDVICGVLDCPSGRTTVIYGKKDGHAAWYPAEDAALNKHLPNRPLYHLEAIARARALPVVVACSEAAADTLQNELQGAIVVSIMPGAANRTDWSPLRGRTVTVWPDAGADGLKLACDIARHIDDDQPADSASPLVRVARLPDALPEDWKPGQQPAEGENVNYQAIVDAAVEVKEITDADDESGVEYPKNYVMTPSGLAYLMPSTKEGVPDAEIEVTTRPFEVVALASDHLGKGSSIVMKWRDDQGRPQTFIAPKYNITNPRSDVFSRMSDADFGYDPSKATYLRTFLMKLKCSSFVRLVDKCGWDKSEMSAFIMPGGEVVGNGDGDKIVFRSEGVDIEKAAEDYSESGTLEEWQDNVARLAVGNDLLVLALCIAFTSPLLAPLQSAMSDADDDVEPGGVHLYGTSSTGKSTAAVVAASAWGGRSVLKQWKSTDNGMEGMAERANGTGLFLDEMTAIDARKLNDIIYMLGNMFGKTRMSSDTALRTTKTFVLAFLSSGEHSLATQVASVGGKVMPGVEARMPSIPADVGAGMGLFSNLHGETDPARFSSQLKKAARKYHGTASRHFLRHLVEELKRENFDEFCMKFNKYVREFVEKNVPAGVSGQVRRVASRMGVMAAAGEIATSYGTLPWPKGTAMSSVGAAFQSWRKVRGGDGAAEEINAVQQVRSFLEMYGEERFTCYERAENAIDAASDVQPDDFTGGARNRVGFRRLNKSGTWDYIITPRAWEDVICKGIDPARAARAVCDVGALIVDGRNLKVKQKLPGMSDRVRCYIVTSAIFTAGDASDAQ